MPLTDGILDWLKEIGIRSSVNNNIGWSGNALTEKINRLLPNNQIRICNT